MNRNCAPPCVAADFITTIHTGVTPEGKALDTIMPWLRYTGMSKVELQALWRFLQSVPAKAAGTRKVAVPVDCDNSVNGHWAWLALLHLRSR